MNFFLLFFSFSPPIGQVDYTGSSQAKPFFLHETARREARVVLFLFFFFLKQDYKKALSEPLAVSGLSLYEEG